MLICCLSSCHQTSRFSAGQKCRIVRNESRCVPFVLKSSGGLFLCFFFNVVFQCSNLKQVMFFVIQFCCSQGSRLANGSLCRGHSATAWSDVCWHHLTTCICSGVDDIFKKRHGIWIQEVGGCVSPGRKYIRMKVDQL